MVEKFGFVHISAGDCLRSEAKKGSELGAMINKHIEEGTIVPAEITINCLLLEIGRNLCLGLENILIDGFPRNQDNLDGWNKIVGSKVNVSFILYLRCSEDEMLNRLCKRGETSGR